VSDSIITVENLGKKYSLRHLSDQRYIALRDVLVEKATGLFRRNGKSRGQRSDVGGQDANLTCEEFWALKDISFEVKQGEVVGIIGRNGAGKSTLLKILSRITDPTEGRVRIKGRVASLLEVGTGFHPELTGRENIFLNGAILGMTRAEINNKFDEIVAFAETEKFLDTPVKRYSSGMYVRLAFAVAAHLEPEILIVDEVLAVGDAAFQKKCLGKMENVAKQNGRTVIFVSHNMSAVQGLCSKGICLDAGRAVEAGEISKVVRHYLQRVSASNSSATEVRIGSTFSLKGFHFSPGVIVSGSSVRFKIELFSHLDQCLKELAILLFSEYGGRIAILDLRQFGLCNLKLQREILDIEGAIRDLPLVEGEYRVGLYIATDAFHTDVLDIATITVANRASASEIVPYPPPSRGIIELDFDVTGIRHRT
jgi:lipopolysaccharide transport system ATP-binding protein